MRLSSAFIPTLKETPAEAQSPSHRLMLRAGLVRQHASGIYNWLPLGVKVLRKIESIIRTEQASAGAQEIIMPTIQSAELWKESGRYEDYGPEMLRFQDRHQRDLLYGPTHEEVVTDIFRNNIKSFKDLPLNLYQINWKFRDEIRPRFGVMRGREFLMKDGYSFDTSYEKAKQSYYKMFVSYLRIFSKMGLKAIPMKADPGPIGGDMSHEFIVLANTGESEVFLDKELLSIRTPNPIDYSEDLKPIVDNWMGYYAATDEEFDEATAKDMCTKLIKTKGIEVGHIFYFGQKYSDSMEAEISGPSGSVIRPYMGSYGIGVSRLVGAIIESNHDENGIIWPFNVTPYELGIINLKPEDSETTNFCETVYRELQLEGFTVIYDDRQDRAGVKFAEMDLIGVPWQLIVGPKGVQRKIVELKERSTGDREEVEMSSFVNIFTRVCCGNISE